MIADTHVAIETVLTKVVDEMEIIIEEVAEHAHALGAQIETPGVPELTAAIVMIQMSSHGKIVAAGMKAVDQAEVRKEKAHLR